MVTFKAWYSYRSSGHHSPLRRLPWWSLYFWPIVVSFEFGFWNLSFSFPSVKFSHHCYWFCTLQDLRLVPFACGYFSYLSRLKMVCEGSISVLKDPWKLMALQFVFLSVNVFPFSCLLLLGLIFFYDSLCYRWRFSRSFFYRLLTVRVGLFFLFFRVLYSGLVGFGLWALLLFPAFVQTLTF